MKSPRETFLKSKAAPQFNLLVATEAFELACDYALLQLQSEMRHNLHPSLPTDPYVGFDANAQMQGAARVIEILKTIGIPPEKLPKPTKDTLHYG